MKDIYIGNNALHPTLAIKYWGLCRVQVLAHFGWLGTADTGVAPKTPTFHSAKRSKTKTNYKLIF